MTAIISNERKLDTLIGVPWEIFELIDDIFGEHHLRLCYLRGKLSLYNPITWVSWDEYQKFLVGLKDFNLPHIFDHGVLYMVSPRREHDSVSRMLVRLVGVATVELRLPTESIGSTTLDCEAAQVSIQADEAFYVQHEPQVRESSDLDLKRDPPPDLAIEIVWKNPAPRKLDLYSQIGVREVWQYRAGKLEFFHLAGKGYEPVARSVVIPILTPELLTHFLKLRKKIGETEAIIEFTNKIRELIQQSASEN